MTIAIQLCPGCTDPACFDCAPTEAVTLPHAHGTHSPSGLPHGTHCRADLVWYGGVIGLLERGSDEGPRPYRCLLGRLAQEAAPVSSAPAQHWLAPGAAEREEMRERARAIEAALAALRRESEAWHKLLHTAWVVRAGRVETELTAYYADLGTVCSTHAQRETWTSKRGVFRTERAGNWARAEFAAATTAYDRLRVQQGGG